MCYSAISRIHDTPDQSSFSTRLNTYRFCKSTGHWLKFSPLVFVQLPSISMGLSLFGRCHRPEQHAVIIVTGLGTAITGYTKVAGQLYRDRTQHRGSNGDGNIWTSKSMLCDSDVTFPFRSWIVESWIMLQITRSLWVVQGHFLRVVES
jgi:hypothetical protein